MRLWAQAASRRDVSTTLDMTIGVGARHDKKGLDARHDNRGWLLDMTRRGRKVMLVLWSVAERTNGINIIILLDGGIFIFCGVDK